MNQKKTLVIGASENPERYSNMAIHLLLQNKYSVEAVGLKEGFVSNVHIQKGYPHFDNIHTVTLYVSPANQKNYYSYILGLNPKRIIFNPGTENDELKEMAEDKGIATENACTLVLLRLNQY